MNVRSFRELSHGTHFEKSKYQSVMARFKEASGFLRPSTAHGAAEVSDAPVSVEASALPPSLDFFGNDRATAPPKPKDASRRRTESLESIAVRDATELLRVPSARLSAPSVAVVPQAESDQCVLRKKLGLQVKGVDAPPLLCSFAEMPFGDSDLRAVVLRNIEYSHFTEPTPIQMQSIPSLLHHRDFIGVSPTGTGKTAAYLLPLIVSLRRRSKEGLRAIVVVPTRELAMQIEKEFLRLCQGRQLSACYLSKSLTAGNTLPNAEKIDLLLTTPLRLLGLLREGAVDLNHLVHLVLDESDKLFEMGFVSQIDEILSYVPSSCQKSLFSATLPQEVEKLANSILKDPLRCVVGTLNGSSDSVKQELVYVGNENGKVVAIRNLFVEGFQPPLLIFVQSKERADDLYKELMFDGIPIEVIHSGRSKSQRDEVIERFRRGSIWILIATDLMGRGIDFKGINMVINFDLPQTVIQYIHRVGRTGRANRSGCAVTYFTEDDIVPFAFYGVSLLAAQPLVRSIANVMKLSGSEVPEWILRMKKLGRSRVKSLSEHPIKRHRIQRVSKFKHEEPRSKPKKRRTTAGDSSVEAESLRGEDASSEAAEEE